MPCRHYCGRLAACNICNLPISADSAPFERRCDRPFTNLSQVQNAGKVGLEQVFPVGSLWEYGPFVEGRDPVVVRIVPKGSRSQVFTSGKNYSMQPEDRAAYHLPTFFINCEIVRSAGESHPCVTGFPPHTLSPHHDYDTYCYYQTQRVPCYSPTVGILQSQRAEIERLRIDLQKALFRADKAEERAARFKQMVDDARVALTTRR